MKTKKSVKISFVLVVLISLTIITTILLWYFIPPAYKFFLLPIAATISLLLYIFCAVTSLLSLKQILAKISLVIILATIFAIIAMWLLGIPLMLNFHLLKNGREIAYQIAISGELSEIGNDGTMFIPPAGQEYLAFDGIAVMDSESQKPAVFYYTTGLLGDNAEGLIYTPDGEHEIILTNVRKIVRLDDNWIYFIGEYQKVA